MDRYTMEEQIQEIQSSSLYKSGETFALYQMLHLCTKVKHLSRISEVLREMKARGLVKSHGKGRKEVYFRNSGDWIRSRWISDEAERLCEGHCAREVTGQAARDAIYGSRRMAGASQEACRDMV